MLPVGNRLRSAADFAAVVRVGRRVGTRRLVIHLLPTGQQGSPRAGFVVSTKVGNSVVRHRVTRRLRPLVRAQLETLAPGIELVIRALPSAAGASSAALAADLSSGVATAVRKSTTIGRSSTSRSSVESKEGSS